MSNGSSLHAFLSGTGTDFCGRTLSDILSFDDTEIEATHDFIQWLFPLPVASSAQPNAPVLSSEELSAIAGDAEAVANLKLARRRMENFYLKNDHWLRGYDHNHLRITRILTSLRLLVGVDEARSFYAVIADRLKTAPRAVNPRSLQFWAQALAPEPSNFG
jgi:hypothetical protein